MLVSATPTSQPQNMQFNAIPGLTYVENKGQQNTSLQDTMQHTLNTSREIGQVVVVIADKQERSIDRSERFWNITKTITHQRLNVVLFG